MLSHSTRNHHKATDFVHVQQALFHARKKCAGNCPPTAKINTSAHCRLRFEPFWTYFGPFQILKRKPKRNGPQNRTTNFAAKELQTRTSFWYPKRHLVLKTKTNLTSARNPFRNIYHLLKVLPSFQASESTNRLEHGVVFTHTQSIARTAQSATYIHSSAKKSFLRRRCSNS